jgi:lysophospholipase L1-like esterase
VPDSLKTTTFLVFCAKSPHYIALMDPARAHLLANLYTEATTRASADGLNGIEPCRDFDEDDYVDPTHLSVSGADKLAHAMALAIKQLNEQP